MKKIFPLVSLLILCLTVAGTAKSRFEFLISRTDCFNCINAIAPILKIANGADNDSIILLSTDTEFLDTIVSTHKLNKAKTKVIELVEEPTSSMLTIWRDNTLVYFTVFEKFDYKLAYQALNTIIKKETYTDIKGIWDDFGVSKDYVYLTNYTKSKVYLINRKTKESSVIDFKQYNYQYFKENNIYPYDDKTVLDSLPRGATVTSSVNFNFALNSVDRLPLVTGTLPMAKIGPENDIRYSNSSYVFTINPLEKTLNIINCLAGLSMVNLEPFFPYIFRKDSVLVYLPLKKDTAYLGLALSKTYKLGLSKIKDINIRYLPIISAKGMAPSIFLDELNHSVLSGYFPEVLKYDISSNNKPVQYLIPQRTIEKSTKSSYTVGSYTSIAKGIGGLISWEGNYAFLNILDFKSNQVFSSTLLYTASDKKSSKIFGNKLYTFNEKTHELTEEPLHQLVNTVR